MDDLYAACETLVKGGYCTYGIGFHPDGFYFNGVLGREGLQAYDAGNGYDGQITKCLYTDGGTVQNTIYNMLDNYQKLYKNTSPLPGVATTRARSFLSWLPATAPC